ncbi:MAG: phage holin family protein [Proteobacteria bacterium]|nr:phage holin family protein [Pseudomonadota bacterium]
MVFAAVLPTAVALGVRYLNRKWNLNISDMEMNRTTALADEAVAAIEQKYKGAEKSAETNKKKLGDATDTLMKHLKREGIKLDKDSAQTKIEKAVADAAPKKK